MTSAPSPDAEFRDRGSFRATAETLFMVGGVTAAARASTGAGVLPAAAADLLYLLPVLAAASLHGPRAGLLAAIAGAVAYNFFFTEPVHTLWISDPGDLVTVGVLLAVALVTGRLAARLRARARDASIRAERDAMLATFSQALVGVGEEAELGRALCAETGRLFGVNAALVVLDASSPRLLASSPPLDRLAGIELDAAALAITTGRPAGRGTGALQGGDWTFHPLSTARGTVGALGLARDDGLAPVRIDQTPILATVLAQAALALERQRLATEVAGVEVLRERDRLRGALLSSVGHDLRTPLTAVLAAAAELRRESSANADVVATLESEARRLDRYIANLLDMVRIEAGAIRLSVEPVDLTDAAGAAVRDVARGLKGRPLQVEVPPDLPLVRLDPQLLHHCLINLIDNAAVHGRPGTPIAVVAERDDDGLSLSVVDEGPGLPAGAEARVFETFVRLEGSDRRGGTGLGLAIVKGFAEVMGAEVAARDRGEPRGAVFTLRFPAALLVDGDRAEAAE